MATVREQTPAYRESYQALRAYVREWTLARGSYDDRGQHMALDSSAPFALKSDRGSCLPFPQTLLAAHERPRWCRQEAGWSDVSARGLAMSG